MSWRCPRVTLRRGRKASVSGDSQCHSEGAAVAQLCGPRTSAPGGPLAAAAWGQLGRWHSALGRARSPLRDPRTDTSFFDGCLWGGRRVWTARPTGDSSEGPKDRSSLRSPGRPRLCWACCGPASRLPGPACLAPGPCGCPSRKPPSRRPSRDAPSCLTEATSRLIPSHEDVPRGCWRRRPS